MAEHSLRIALGGLDCECLVARDVAWSEVLGIDRVWDMHHFIDKFPKVFGRANYYVCFAFSFRSKRILVLVSYLGSMIVKHQSFVTIFLSQVWYYLVNRMHMYHIIFCSFFDSVL